MAIFETNTEQPLTVESDESVTFYVLLNSKYILRVYSIGLKHENDNTLQIKCFKVRLELRKEFAVSSLLIDFYWGNISTISNIIIAEILFPK